MSQLTTQNTPDFDEMTIDERKGVWEGLRCKWEDRFKSLELPRMFADAKMSDFSKDYRKLEGSPVFISGPPGTGKTHLLAALAKKQLTLGSNEKSPFDPKTQEELFYAKFINIVDLLAQFRGTMSSRSVKTEEDLFNDYAKCSHLYLDDLGVQSNTDWVSQTIYRIIDHRYSNLLPTSITSNCSIQELEKSNSRIASRIVGSCSIVEMSGDDKRYQI